MCGVTRYDALYRATRHELCMIHDGSLRNRPSRAGHRREAHGFTRRLWPSTQASAIPAERS